MVVSLVAALRDAASMDRPRDATASEDVAGRSEDGAGRSEDGAERSGDATEPPAGAAPAVSARVLQVIDRVLSEAIEGVSTSLRHAALIDPLTGCANRRGLEEDLERAMAGANRTGLDVALTVIDLDGLKQINDTNGHAAGDASQETWRTACDQSSARPTPSTGSEATSSSS